MSRKMDIDRLLRLNRQQRIPAIARNWENRGEQAAQDAIYGDIKAVLESLRSVLDFAYRDLEDAAGRLHTQDLYFPFVHPVGRNGTVKTKAGILTEFHQKPLVPEIKRAHPAVYDSLRAVQGEQWLSEMIKTVNPQKHERLDALGTRYLLGSSLPIKIFGGGGFNIASGSTVYFQGVKVTGPAVICPEKPIPASAAPAFYQSETLDEPSFKEKWIERLKDWNNRITDLIDQIYSGL
jgi:hypothetical protein